MMYQCGRCGLTRASSQEPIGLAIPQCKCPFEFLPPVASAAPQRTWVNATTWRGLTDEEVNELVEHTECEDYYGLVEATEAKLKAKNERKEKNTHE